MEIMRRFDRYELCAALSSAIFFLSSTVLVLYLTFSNSEPYSKSEILRISEIRRCLSQRSCHDLDRCSREIIWNCLGIQKPKQRVDSNWFLNTSCQLYLTQITDEIMSDQSQILKQGLSGLQTKNLRQMKKAIHFSPSYILHWAVDEPKIEGENHWRQATKFKNEHGIYTVTPGPASASNDSAIIATEDGVYYIYAKITFMCKRANDDVKRPALRVLLEEPSVATPKEILVASEAAQCFADGDLVSLYQSGHFSLQAWSKIYLEYKIPVGVFFSRGDNMTVYKSYIGAFKVMSL